MSKTITSLLIMGMLCLACNLNGQLASWNLTTDGSVSSVASNVSADDFTRGNGIGAISFGSAGAKARGWTTNMDLDGADYFQICLSPDSGYNLDVDGLNFSESRTEDGIREFEVQWSLDNFSTSTTIATISVPDDENERTVSLTSLGIDVCDGETLCFRWYGYKAEEELDFWSFGDTDLTVTGTVVTPCTPPTVQASGLNFNAVGTASMNVNFTPGDGTSRLVVARLGSPVTALPCNGKTYTSNAQFGFGDELADGQYVIYSGTGSTVNTYGLIEGATYYFAIFEFNNTDYCYLRNSPLEGNNATLCFIASQVQNVITVPGNKNVTLSWDNPFCSDEVLIVASTSPIVGTPTGNGSTYVPNTIYGAGVDNGSDFSDPEFPVYKGTGNTVEITQLANSTDYYFAFFSRKNSNWSAAILATDKPKAGCFDLGGNDVVFVNEIHYLNTGQDQDEGIEIAGPAGTDLSFYKLELYSGSSSMVYHTESLRGVIDNEINDFGAIWFSIPNMEDGKGGIALYNTVTATVVQFISYRGTIMAADGEAINMTSSSIGVFETSTTTAGESLQLTGTGNCPADLTWNSPGTQSLGSLNVSQSALPVELRYFTARLEGKEVLLNWETVVEVNNDYMAVEKSVDGRSFVEIGRRAGAGTTALPQKYQLTDPNPQNGINYYRLRQVDFDGTTEVFKTVVVEVKAEKTTTLQVFPTVSHNEVFINTQGESGVISLINIHGQVLQTQYFDGTTNLNIEELSSGHYWIRFEGAGIIEQARFIKS